MDSSFISSAPLEMNRLIKQDHDFPGRVGGVSKATRFVFSYHLPPKMDINKLIYQVKIDHYDGHFMKALIGDNSNNAVSQLQL